MKFILMDELEKYERDPNVYEIHLMGPATLRMNIWWPEDEW